jgi:hypothetical protein
MIPLNTLKPLILQDGDPMKKYLYIVTTVKTVEQTYEYEFESDKELTQAQAKDYIFNQKHEDDVGSFHNDLLDKEVIESVVDFHKHDNWSEEKP